MTETTFSLRDLGIVDEDIIDVHETELEDGGLEIQFEVTEEASAIIEAFCNREGITAQELLKALVLNRPLLCTSKLLGS